MTTLEIISIYQILKEENERADKEYSSSIDSNTEEKLQRAINARSAFENHEWK